MAQWEERATQINMVELVAPVLRGKLVITFVDSESVEGAMILGSSHKEGIKNLVTFFWELVLVNDIGVHVARLPTDSNLSDGPASSKTGQRWRTHV